MLILFSFYHQSALAIAACFVRRHYKGFVKDLETKRKSKDAFILTTDESRESVDSFIALNNLMINVSLANKESFTY
ncbi:MULTISPECIES: hypothetical protein [Sphingobacterium]|uniref:hypothetical protein n=1 Tax=Sphingobacterium TaxID=28453 RepID=UPI0013DC23AE|nr:MULTISPECIES: hypothetical protein [unclassified Sphingobacterium]